MSWSKVKSVVWQKEYKCNSRKREKANKAMNKWLTGRAKVMRKNLTPSEEALHNILKSNKIRHIMQKPVVCKKNHRYIADCWISSQKLIIEVDGGYHSTLCQSRRDTYRTADFILKDPDIRVIRITNDELASSGAGFVVEKIQANFL